MRPYVSISLSLLACTLPASAQSATWSQDWTLCKKNIENQMISQHEAQPWIDQLLNPCVESLEDDGADIWNSRACVAAAVAMSPYIIVNYVACSRAAMPEQHALPSLDRRVYHSIVSDNCAMDSPICNVTVQSLVELVYKNLGWFGASTYPRSVTDLVANVIDPIFAWADRARETLAYEDFDDWLHMSGPPAWSENGAPNRNMQYFYSHVPEQQAILST